MSIRSKLTIIFLAIALIPLFLVSMNTFHNYQDSLESSRLSQLQNLIIFKADKIETYFNSLKTDLGIIQSGYAIKKNLPVLTRLANNPANPEFIAARKMLDEVLLNMPPILGLVDIMLAAPSGKVVYSSDPEHSAKDFLGSFPAPGQKAFQEGKDKIYLSDIFLDKTMGNKPSMMVTAPAFDFNGSFIGVIGLELDMTHMYKIIQDITGLGNTGETLIGKLEGNQVVYLNPLRHDQKTALEKHVAMGGIIGKPIQEAVQGKNDSGRLIDYRGEEVIAAWRYLPSLGWGMVAKIDSREAFADVKNLRHLLFIILGVIVILSGIAAFSIAQSISGPIKKLSKGTQIIGSGNLDYKVATDSKDEIGQLSRTFDKMIQDLKQTTASRDELNREITERKQAEKELRESEKRLTRAQEIAHLGSWELDLVNDHLSWSDEVYRIFGLKPQEFAATYEAFLERIHPDDRAAVDAAYSNSLRDGKDTYEIEHRVVNKSTGEVRIVHEKCEHTRDEAGKVIRSVGMVHDITERKKAETEIKRSNENLEQFAYVASHDLQEPLRVMSSYSQLLEKRYKDKLDQDADDFIEFIVDAARRMQMLITNLLEYSRVGRKEILATKVDSNELVDKAVKNLSESVKSTGAAVTRGNLPVVHIPESGFLQLFQNLIGNAIKFHGAEPPKINISAEKRDSDWLFSVKDNGIGIEPQYKDKVFQIFQRLHSRHEYPGTGIGLAICKKIVENHGGRIWLESQAGKGTTFYFTIPRLFNILQEKEE
ncbi:MAG: ATP-binding protein [Candidatus Brocadiia bacterium]